LQEGLETVLYHVGLVSDMTQFCIKLWNFCILIFADPLRIFV